jgi:hypothetical protein
LIWFSTLARRHNRTNKVASGAFRREYPYPHALPLTLILDVSTYRSFYTQMENKTKARGNEVCRCTVCLFVAAGAQTFVWLIGWSEVCVERVQQPYL